MNGKKFWIGLGIGALLVIYASMALATPPPWAPAHGRQKSKTKVTYAYQYRYYPNVQVYFDATRKLYFYLAQGQWVQAETLPAALLSQLANFVLLDMETATPQEFHQDVTKVYTSSQTVTVTGSNELVIAPAQIQTQPTTAAATQTQTATHQYMYYPAMQVYFDTIRELYFYQAEGQWYMAPSLPENLYNALADFVMMEIATENPLEFHQQVLTTYPAAQPGEVSLAVQIPGLEQVQGALTISTQTTTVTTGNIVQVPRPAEPQPQPAQAVLYQYHYYPDAEVYFDTGRQMYFYQVEGQWYMAPALPEEISSQLTEFVVVEMETENPLEYHQEIQQTYPPAQVVEVPQPAQPGWTVVQTQTQETVVVAAESQSTQTTTQTQEEVEREYLYYPELELYFDAVRQLYFYFANNQWVQAATLPGSLQIGEAGSIKLMLKTKTPYLFHLQIKKKYPPGQLKKLENQQQVKPKKKKK